MQKTVIVTGSSRGIGATTAIMAARRAYRVIVNYASQAERARQVVRTIQEQGGQAVAIEADVSDETAVKNLFEQATAQFGPVTALVNNAGITGKIGPLSGQLPSALRRVMEVNVLGSMFCCQEAVRRMAVSQGGTGGAIVNITSRAAQYGSPNEFCHYAASKAAVESFSFGLASEVATEGIRVNCVSAGLVDTELHAAAGDPGRAERFAPRIPMQRAGTTEEIAAAVIWLLSDEASYCTGSVLAVTGGR